MISRSLAKISASIGALAAVVVDLAQRAGAARLVAARQPFFQLLAQFDQRDRLGQVVVHAGGQAFFGVAALGVGRHRHQRRAPADGLLEGADVGGRFVAVHLRHAAIHQDQVELAVRAASTASRPLEANSQAQPFMASMPAATIWLVRLSSATRMRNSLRPAIAAPGRPCCTGTWPPASRSLSACSRRSSRSGLPSEA
jgi:hypothetical protein